MSATPVALPVLSPGGPLRLTPTDVSSFVRHEQCERFLRFRLAERAGQDFMTAYDVAPQRIAPLLSLSGREFEEGIEQTLAAAHIVVNYAALAGGSHNRPENNARVAAEARGLPPGRTVLLFQTRLQVELAGWLLRGDVDLLRLEREPDGTLRVLVTDLKSTTEAKVEHRLQVAFYRLMLTALFEAEGIPHAPLDTAILFHPPVAPSPEEDAELQPLRDAAHRVFGLTGHLLEVTADPEAYAQAAHDLVLGPDSTARRVAAAAFDGLPYCLSPKCDQCLYAEFCMKWSAEHEDLSLLPYLSGTEKNALRRAGVATIRDLAALKDFAPPGGTAAAGDLVPAIGQEALVRRLSATWPVGPRLDELVHRARQFRRSAKKDGTDALPFIPGRGNSTLPASKPGLNPNLVWVYLDAQQDYLEDRVYLLGALVVGCKDGVPAARRSVVRMAGGPPDSPAVERDLLVGWTRDLLKAVVEVAQGGEADGGKKSAPVHVVFFDRGEQRVLLEALARNFPPILDHTPPLYDFLTQLAAFDSPIASHLDEEVREQKNYPMTCQSLQSVATYLKFDWNTPEKFREIFRARLFDYLGKLDIDGQTEWYTRRSRFSSSIPLEYAYAAWGVLPAPRPGGGDEFADYRGATRDQLLAFQARRLEAVESIAGKLTGNPNTTKTPFVLPDIARFDDKARSLAQALDEFVTIERLVALADWKATRHAPPERRVLMGECLLGRYAEADQAPGVADQNRENERRRRLREEYVAAFKAKNPGKAVRLPKEQSAECKWSPEGLRVKLRLETAGVDCDLHEVLGLTDLREGTRVVLYPRWAVDERLPPADRTPFVPTPKQMLYGNRADIVRVEVERDAGGRATAGYVELELVESFGGEWSRGFVFPAINRTLEEGGLYTLDECPNDWYGYFCSQVVEGLGGGQPNALYRRLVAFPPAGDGTGRPGQERFLAGLDAFHAAGRLHGFEPGKRDYIGGHGSTPVLLVQGPPGTGKSYSTAFAVFARLQGAMQDGRPLRAFASCKTHAATDVLVENVRDVRNLLAKLRAADPSLFDRFFDARLLEVPIYRVAPNDPPPDGVIPLAKDNDKGKDEEYNADLILEGEWAVVGATPGGVYGMLKAKWPKNLFGHDLCDLLVLDEASQMNLPEACMAALALKPDAPLVVVGDHRQMPPIVKHDWEAEARRTFREYAAYASLFETLLGHGPPVIRFEESFRLHGAMAEFLRREVYRHDGIPYHSRRRDVLPAHPIDDPFVAAVLQPDYPLVVVTHGETDSQLRNPFEQSLVEPVVRTLADPARYGLDAADGVGVVVPHRAQRAALQQAFPDLCVVDATTGLPGRSAIDTVERFQGGERTVILVSATESDPAYLLAAGEFLLDPRRLTVAVSRAKRKMVLVAARSVFALFSPDEEVFANSLLWKNLLLRTCTTLLWEGDRGGIPVAVWGGRLDG